ncbi:MAG: response regulator [Deltaproteobacteria bacterium]|nr:response regulator [Deltaproteobacteria bacterium]
MSILLNKDESDSAREYAATILGNLGDIRAIPPLISTLNDVDSLLAPCLQGAIVSALYKFQEPCAIAALQELHSTYILCIDDETTVIESISDILWLEGIQCIGAKNGLEGIERAIALIPKLILLDLSLPGMNGDEVYGHLGRVAGDHF